MASRFQRMVVIPENEYIQLTTLQQVKQPLAQKFYNVNQEYENAATISDPYSRLAVRSTTLSELKGLNDEMRNYLTITTPKPYRSRAERLFSVLEPNIRWNEKGEIIHKVTNTPINNSQLTDLIQHAVSDRRRRNISPTGWDYFLKQLREHNVPQMLLNLSTLDELKAASPAPTTTSLKTDAGTSMSRPKIVARRRLLSPTTTAHADEPKKKVQQRGRSSSLSSKSKSNLKHKRRRTLPQHLKDYFPYLYEK